MDKDGLSAGKKYSVCGKVTQEQSVIYQASVVKLDKKSYTYDGKAKRA